MDHVELGGRVLACEGKDRELATRVILEEVRDVEDTVMKDHPAVGLVVVARNLVQAELGRRRRRRRGSTTAVATGRGLSAAGLVSSRELHEGGGHSLAHHVLRCVLASNATEDDA